MMYLLLGFLVVALLFMVTGVSGAPWVPARTKDITDLLDSAHVTKGTKFLELGCGDGRLVKAAAQRGAQAIGYELNPLLFLIAWFRCLGVAGATIVLGDLWRVNLSSYDVVMAFLVPRTMPRLHAKAAKELRPSALLVSYIFPIEGKNALKSYHSWHIYTYSAKKSAGKK